MLIIDIWASLVTSEAGSFPAPMGCSENDKVGTAKDGDHTLKGLQGCRNGRVVADAAADSSFKAITMLNLEDDQIGCSEIRSASGGYALTISYHDHAAIA